MRPISARGMATSCLVMSDPPPKTSEVLTGSSMQIKIPNGNIWAKKLGKTSGQNEILSETPYYYQQAIVTVRRLIVDC